MKAKSFLRPDVYLFQMEPNLYYVSHEVRADGWHRVFSFDLPLGSKNISGEWTPPTEPATFLDFVATQSPHRMTRSGGKEQLTPRPSRSEAFKKELARSPGLSEVDFEDGLGVFYRTP